MCTRSILVVLCCWMISVPGLAQSATVKSERAVVRAAAEPGARAMAELKAGAKVEVEFSVGASDQEWCYLHTASTPAVSGYMRCDELDRGRPSHVAPSPMAELPPVLTDAELARLNCRAINFRGWMARYEFTEEQLQRADEIAEETGLKGCAEKASPYVRRYVPEGPLDSKVRLMREWAAADPENRCVGSWRRFWARMKLIMTDAQKARLSADVPAIQEAVARVHGDIRKCVPMFCFF